MAEISVVLVMLVAVVLSQAITLVLPFAVPLPLVQIALGALLAAVMDVGVPLNPDIFFLLFIPPLLFLDGEKDDPGVRYVTMRQRLDELGLPHELAVVEGCTHGAWGKSPWLERMVGEMDRFLSARLKAVGR